MNDFYYRLRTIIDKIPRFIFPIVLLIIIILIPYSDTITGEATLTTFEEEEACAIARLPYRHITQLKEGTSVVLQLDGYKIKKNGIHCGYITHINIEAIEISEEAFFSFTILLSSDRFMHKGMKGKASVNLPRKNLLSRAVQSINSN